jgi:hypothetical protein
MIVRKIYLLSQICFMAFPVPRLRPLGHLS